MQLSSASYMLGQRRLHSKMEGYGESMENTKFSVLFETKVDMRRLINTWIQLEYLHWDYGSKYLKNRIKKGMTVFR